MENQNYAKKRGRTAKSILYLLLSFPLGVLYFVFLVTGLSLGVSTIIIWIGIPILFLLVAGIRGMAVLERDLAVQMLDVDIPRAPRRPTRTWRESFRIRVTDTLTWKSLIYLFLKFPLGTFSFCLTITLVVSSLALILALLAYLIATSIVQGLDPSEPFSFELFNFFWWSIPITGIFNPLDFAKTFAISLLGVGWAFCSRYMLNGLAWLSGVLACALISPSESIMATPKEDHFNYYQQHAYLREEQVQFNRPIHNIS